MRYGIKRTGTDINAISRFSDNVVPADFSEISKDEYDDYISLYNPFYKWNDAVKDIEEDTAAKNAYNEEKITEEIFLKMEVFKKDLELFKDLNRDTTQLQNEYDALLLDYNQRTQPQ